jgi:hypothetical protein
MFLLQQQHDKDPKSAMTPASQDSFDGEHSSVEAIKNILMATVAATPALPMSPIPVQSNQPLASMTVQPMVQPSPQAGPQLCAPAFLRKHTLSHAAPFVPGLGGRNTCGVSPSAGLAAQYSDYGLCRRAAPAPAPTQPMPMHAAPPASAQA